jgi:polysaccharide pyruvyl transferase WcaK-like protein
MVSLKKIGILTYFWAHNAGTFLQAFSMLNTFRCKFPQAKVELIDLKHRRVFFKPGLGNVSIKQIFKDMRRYCLYECAKKQYLTRSKECLTTQDSERAWQFIEKQKYDLVVVGSDTVLQFLPFHFKGNNVPAYWLHPSLKCKKVMCAVSCGGLTYGRLSEEQRCACRDSLNSFDLVGVRDDATLLLMKELGINDESKLSMVPDPTFVLNIDYSHSENLIKRKRIDFSKPTVAMFLHRSIKSASAVADYYRSRDYQVVSMSATKYADLCLTDISPFEWAGIYRKFSIVLTGAFHGALFSLKNNTPVLLVIYDKSFITPRGLSKYRSLLKFFDLDRTNIINGFGIDDHRFIIEKAERALANHDKEAIRSTLENSRGRFNRFVDSICQIL